MSDVDLEARGLRHAPDGLLFGFRSWAIKGGLLRSPGLIPLSWPLDRPVRALCFKAFVWRTHSAPGSGCTCGIYAHRHPPQPPATRHPLTADTIGLRHVRGVVQLWGHVVVHRAGYRAEFARLAAVEVGPLAEEVADDYNVPIVSSLEAWAPPNADREST